MTINQLNPTWNEGVNSDELAASNFKRHASANPVIFNGVVAEDLK